MPTSADEFVALVIRRSGATPKILQKELNSIKRWAFKVGGEFWHKTYRAQHFERKAFNIYEEYEPRSGEQGGRGSKAFFRSYTGFKQKYLHHTRPLVKSGESEERTRRVDVRATSTSKKSSFKVILHANTLNFRPPNSQINMRAEVTAVTVHEADKISEVIAASIERGIGHVSKFEVQPI